MGPSSGISTACADCRAEEARVDLSVPVLDFRATDAVEVRVERVEVRPGMLAVASGVGCCVVWSVVDPALGVVDAPALSCLFGDRAQSGQRSVRT